MDIVDFMLAHPWSTRTEIHRATSKTLSTRVRTMIEERYSIVSRTGVRGLEEYRLIPLTEEQIAENASYYNPYAPVSDNHPMRAIWQHLKSGQC